MIPSGIATAIAFLVLIAPGFVLEGLFLKRRAQPNESSFAEANRVVLSSLAFSGLSIAIVDALTSPQLDRRPTRDLTRSDEG